MGEKCHKTTTTIMLINNDASENWKMFLGHGLCLISAFVQISSNISKNRPLCIPNLNGILIRLVF